MTRHEAADRSRANDGPTPLTDEQLRHVNGGMLGMLIEAWVASLPEEPRPASAIGGGGQGCSSCGSMIEGALNPE